VAGVTPDKNRKIAVVSGASSGIGAATAMRLAREGMAVLLVARRLDRLEALTKRIEADGGKAYPIMADLARERERARVLREVYSRFGRADVLVNGAGLGWYGYGEEMTWRTARQLLRVNVEAVVQLTLGFLREMRRVGTGHIINVGSISGSIPSQGIAVYGATKSFLDNFTTALHRELRGTEVRVSVVRTGAVRTEFGATALRAPNGLHLPTESFGISAGAVADGIWDLIVRPRRLIYIPRWLWVVPWMELSFGWIIDRIGPLLLRRQKARPIPW
jgi:short-subunit dehydrogenase